MGGLVDNLPAILAQTSYPVPVLPWVLVTVDNYECFFFFVIFFEPLLNLPASACVLGNFRFHTLYHRIHRNASLVLNRSLSGCECHTSPDGSDHREFFWHSISLAFSLSDQPKVRYRNNDRIYHEKHCYRISCNHT
jgi:hypothetical protein